MHENDGSRCVSAANRQHKKQHIWIALWFENMGLHVLFYHLLKYKYLHRLDGGHNVKTVKGGVKKVFLFTSVERVLVALSFR